MNQSEHAELQELIEGLTQERDSWKARVGKLESEVSRLESEVSNADARIDVMHQVTNQVTNERDQLRIDLGRALDELQRLTDQVDKLDAAMIRVTDQKRALVKVLVKLGGQL